MWGSTGSARFIPAIALSIPTGPRQFCRKSNHNSWPSRSRKLASELTATLDYDYGGVLDLGKPDVSLQEAGQWTVMRDRHSVAAKASGLLPVCKTRWIASYRWTSGQALTPVDMFDASAGQADPYLSFFIRQPIPGTSFLPGHMDALIDVRNLLAQGYVPMLGQDGRTVYLVQSARAVRGGLAMALIDFQLF